MSDWYCTLPFTSISTTTQGYYRPCCVTPASTHHVNDMNFKEYLESDYMKELQEAFLSDRPRDKKIINKYCEKCIVQEKRGIASRRQLIGNPNKNYPSFL